MSTLAAIDAIRTGLEGLGTTADAITTRVRSAAAASSAAVAEAQRNAGEVDRIVSEMQQRVATRADDVALQFQRMADEGNAWAEQAEGIIRQVQEGMVDRLAAINAFGDGLTVIDGQVRSVRDVLSEVLPTMGETQARIREMVAELRAEGAGIDELSRRLAAQHNSYAKELAELVRLMRSGRITIDEVLRRAQELAKAFPGSETAALSDLLAERLRRARRERG